MGERKEISPIYGLSDEVWGFQRLRILRAGFPETPKPFREGILIKSSLERPLHFKEDCLLEGFECLGVLRKAVESPEILVMMQQPPS